MGKVKFVYSWIYDEVFQELYKKNEKEFGIYPKEADIKNYIKKIEKIWEKKESKILENFSEIAGLSFDKGTINCYVVSWVIPFSDPLTIPMYTGYEEYFTDILAHELIHVQLTQNMELLKEYWNFIDENYPNSSRGSKEHILVHAILKKVYLGLGFENQLRIQIEHLTHLEDYKKSWEIVDNEGEDEIIKKMRTYIE